MKLKNDVYKDYLLWIKDKNINETKKI